MALYDNKLWLLSHIHNSFISSDDSGVCELVLGSDNFKDELRVVALNQVLFKLNINHFFYTFLKFLFLCIKVFYKNKLYIQIKLARI